MKQKSKIQNIISYLTQQKYTLVDVGIELQELYKELDNKGAVNHDIGQKIKQENKGEEIRLKIE